MKSLVLLSAVVRHQADLCGVSLERDLVTITRRYEREGDHFLEVVLPELDDMLLRGLENGYLAPTQSFTLSDTRPTLLRPLWRLVFDEFGDLRDDALPAAVSAIRQISRINKKIFEVCPQSFVDAEIRAFVETDEEVGNYFPPQAAVRLVREAVHIVFGKLIASVDWTTLPGKHGPGAVAERHDAVSRWDFGPVNRDVYRVFPTPFPCIYSLPYREVDEEPTCRLVAVPKTSVKPRLIGIEPSGHQFLQQSIKEELYRGFERIPVCSLSSQEPNRCLAEVGSWDGALATLDLSEASDRISNDLVKVLFGRYKGFSQAIQACRTRRTVLPDGSLHVLKKYASMGSALTFPIEVMVFTAIVLTGVALSMGGEFRSNIRTLAKSEFIRIYGDDIIVPVEYARTVSTALELFGLKVNRSKSFSLGLFRESCGADFFAGTNVTPVYRRRRDPRDARDTSEIVSLVAFANLYYDRYGPSPIPDVVHELLRDATGLDVVRHPNPSEFGGLAIQGVLQGATRYNRGLQRTEVRAHTLRVGVKPDRASDEARFRYALDNVRGSVYPDSSRPMDTGIIPGRTLSHGVSAATHIKSRWVSVT